MDTLILREQLNEILDEMLNAQDKFAFLAIFEGVAGKECIDLINFKISDFDFKNNTIKINGTSVKISQQLADYAKEAFKETYYISYKGGTKIKLDNRSAYILKNRAGKKEVSPLQYRGLRQRIATVSSYLRIFVTIKEIELSGVIDKIMPDACNWTIAQVESWIESNNINFGAYKIYKKIKSLL